ncbi:FMN-binding negative transcriptional regulator [Cypionkella psychrotolerans]|uniref:FMN-binding negative transcriptional regulator n=1 Tax=Cypionkella psychrotolerans TaxID=1678131 RepID=UPI0006B5AF84|nr:FMN-binding negative transcriptional regulator [Cypionkella psychrotolerans]
MHPNPAFRSTPLEDNLAFARARGFGVLSVNGADGPLAAHVPFLLSPDASFAELHLARSNPIARACTAGLPALIAISGPDAYISPDWYNMSDQVPTWNYIAVHLRGVLSPLPEAALQPHVDALSAEHENHLLPKLPWQSDKMSEGALPRMLRMILPFRFDVISVDGTWKLNQNKTPEVRASAASHLAQRADTGSQEIAALIRRDLG